MSPAGPRAEREQELRRRLRKFNGRTHHRAAALIGREEMAIKSAGAEEGRSRREAEAASPDSSTKGLLPYPR